MTLLLALVFACADSSTPAPKEEPVKAVEAPPQNELVGTANAVFAKLPAEMSSDTNAITDAKIALGRMLYYETRLSKSHQISCNSCHSLDKYGVDGNPTSPGHKGQLGGRNSPTVYNAALHRAQFWDGRADDVEAQAKGPVLNPIEMAMPGEAQVIATLKSIPGYLPLFQAAFPGEADPITYDNMAKAIGAFERKLVTPSRFDEFLGGKADALSAQEQAGLRTFMDVGCASCHNGAGVGGGVFMKLGQVNPYETKDVGRFGVTNSEADKFVFKVPSLRNIDKTGPYFHDGTVATLNDAIKLMGHHQLGKELTEQQVNDIASFLGALTGELPKDYIAPPTLPESGPTTPKPDAS